MRTFITKKNPAVTLTAYRGDAKTLLAFNLPSKKLARDLAGFTVQVQPQGQAPYYLHNSLRFEHPGNHAQDADESPNASVNAPIHKFRWVHVPGSVHQGVAPFMGKYTYTVTPRYFDGHRSLLPLDKKKSVSVTIEVSNFRQGCVALGFTRGYVQSEAFVRHFGRKARIRPKGKELLFDTQAISGADERGNEYSFAQQYEWLGFTARDQAFELIQAVLADKKLRLDVFAYDFNEPDIAQAMLTLAGEGRIRMILDNAALHHSRSRPTPEDAFEALFLQAATGKAQILRGRFARYAHDKIFIVSRGSRPIKVLTGSTNFSVTGLYVNSNHVLVFTDRQVTAKYAELFDTAWAGAAKRSAFLKTPIAGETFVPTSSRLPALEVTFAPHTREFAGGILDGIAQRVARESRKGKTVGSVLFAVMSIDHGLSPVYEALKNLHANLDVFSFGISDSTRGISLYEPGKRKGVLVTGKPGKTTLPPPFNQVPDIGIGHQIHHKFVVCGFNTDDAVVYCGSSNMAIGGETENGDNLLAIHDRGIATVFAIEALTLVDHFQFLDRLKTKAPAAKAAKVDASMDSRKRAAVGVGWFLSTTDRWVAPYFDPEDLHYVDRKLFA